MLIHEQKALTTKWYFRKGKFEKNAFDNFVLVICTFETIKGSFL
jgi:hypothetical protein